ncbi:metallophosphoesterase [Halorussus rarus]|uniref:metallophosphoesterase family protein n=1 Tax=Halorussus TaxID=1070314 RepID=UPI0013B439D2|nr:metallophosphoesterase family protein [Halorussus rarus]NHN58827.1 metallophosphoesterase family protein [Halorussus sp. JP-T4]
MSRTLIISDVHANATALEAVLAAEPDRDAVVFLGDAVDNGPHPNAVCSTLRDLDPAASVHGNHDRTVLAAEPPAATSDDPFAAWQAWSRRRLPPDDRSFLEALPRTATVSLAGRRLRLHHGDFPRPEAYDGSWRTRATPEDDPALFERVAARYDEDVVVHGHSHFPFVDSVSGTTFVNPGSVGLQREGWPADRARYAVLDDGAFDLRSVRYDAGAVATDSRALDSPFADIWGRAAPGARSD